MALWLLEGVNDPDGSHAAGILDFGIVGSLWAVKRCREDNPWFVGDTMSSPLPSASLPNMSPLLMPPPPPILRWGEKLRLIKALSIGVLTEALEQRSLPSMESWPTDPPPTDGLRNTPELVLPPARTAPVLRGDFR